MHARLKSALTAADALPDAAQAQLAEIANTFLENWAGEPEQYFSKAELAELEKIASEPFVAADPAEVEEIFARHGL